MCYNGLHKERACGLELQKIKGAAKIITIYVAASFIVYGGFLVHCIPSFSTADIRRVEEGSRVLTVTELVWFAVALDLTDLQHLLDMREYDEVCRATVYFQEYQAFGNPVADTALELLSKI